MSDLQKINEQIEANREEMLNTLQELLRIRSVVEPAQGEYPFGAGVHSAFSYVLDKGKAAGFSVKNTDNYGGHVEFPGTEDGVMGIVGHLDVVPEGSGWNHEPYGGVIEDGNIYGRGAIDDKGPVISAFYAMKALKDCGLQPKKTIRLILGLDEETEWEGMDYYLSKEKAPDFGFTPDGDFPAIHGEMGILVFDLVKKMGKAGGKGLELRSLKGGNAPNMVPDFARAVLNSPEKGKYEEIKEKAAEFSAEKQVKLHCKGIGKSLEVTAEGVSAHGAKPQQGVNAVSVLMDFLGQFSFVNEEAGDFVEFYNRFIGYELNGKSLGCGFADEPSGELILNVGMAEIDSKTASLTINVRYPVTMDFESVYDGIMPAISEYDIGAVKGKHQEPIYIPEDDPMIVTLMDVYKKHTEDTGSKPLVIGGGTYARAMKNVIAFGARFPGEPELGHQKNECISISGLMKMTKIYAEAMYRLAEAEAAE